MLVSAKDMLTKAFEGHYAVGQFNINNLEWTKAILQTAQECNSPVILGVSEGAAVLLRQRRIVYSHDRPDTILNIRVLSVLRVIEKLDCVFFVRREECVLHAASWCIRVNYEINRSAVFQHRSHDLTAVHSSGKPFLFCGYFRLPLYFTLYFKTICRLVIKKLQCSAFLPGIS